MRGFQYMIAMAAAAGTVLTAGAAVAQTSGQAAYVAGEAHHDADVRQIEARRDQHAANVAGLHGDRRAQRAYQHASDVRRLQAHRDARFAHHERNVARNAYNAGY